MYKGSDTELVTSSPWRIAFGDLGDSLIVCVDETVSQAGQSSFVLNTNYGVWGNRACDIVARNFTQAEWNQTVGRDVTYDITCENFPTEVEQ